MVAPPRKTLDVNIMRKIRGQGDDVEDRIVDRLRSGCPRPGFASCLRLIERPFAGQGSAHGVGHRAPCKPVLK
jgi:hypothetical protein